MNIEKVTLSECFGLKPFSKTIRESKIAIFGENGIPRSKADLTTIKQYKPKISISLWLGKIPKPNKVIITNLYNYLQPSLDNGWSVKVTNVEDFRGKKLTYDSHNGTDFSIPVGCKVVSPASGKILRVSSEFHRGGLKIFIDHGEGLVTTLGHLSRSFVKVGDIISRGQVVAISGYSGIDALLAFPFSAPHVHMNTWLNGEYVDPFAKDGDISLWKNHNNPTPHKEENSDYDTFLPSVFSEEKFNQAINSLKYDYLKDKIITSKIFEENVINLMFYMNYFPWFFNKRYNLYDEIYPRKSIFDLPFSYKDFDGVAFSDEI